MYISNAVNLSPEVLSKTREQNALTPLYFSKKISITGFNYDLMETRRMFTLTPIGGDKFLITGGHTTEKINEGAPVSKTAEFIKVGQKPRLEGDFIPKSMSCERWGHRAVQLKDGKIFIAGGGPEAVCDLYDPKTNSFTPAGTLRDPRSGSEHIRLDDGKVLIVGGYNKRPYATGALTSIEIFDPANKSINYLGDTQAPRVGHALSRYHGNVYIIGGSDSKSTEIEIWNPYDQTLKGSGIRLPHPLKDFALHQQGHFIYLIGGTNSATKQSSNSIFRVDLRSKTVTKLNSSLSEAREDLSICPSSNGDRALIFSGEIKGGERDGEITGKVEIIDFSKGTVEVLPIEIFRDDARVGRIGPGQYVVVAGTKNKQGELQKGLLHINVK